MKKIWDKGFDNDPQIDAFTVGKDRELDLLLAPYDIEGTMAHITMLSEVGLLEADELSQLLPALEKLRQEALQGQFEIHGEDVHSEVEARLGPLGKKVHTGRSRNDQVALDIKLFTRARIRRTVEKVERLFSLFLQRADELKDVPMPGYTHLQVAMPSSFGLWLGAYAECLCDDLTLLKAAWDINGRNPLGSAAGYGSSAPLDRARTTQLLGFQDLAYNSIYAQMGRGRCERTVAFAYASLAETLGKFATDGCLFVSQNFGFLHLPDAVQDGPVLRTVKFLLQVFRQCRLSSFFQAGKVGMGLGGETAANHAGLRMHLPGFRVHTAGGVIQKEMLPCQAELGLVGNQPGQPVSVCIGIGLPDPLRSPVGNADHPGSTVLNQALQGLHNTAHRP